MEWGYEEEGRVREMELGMENGVMGRKRKGGEIEGGEMEDGEMWEGGGIWQ